MWAICATRITLDQKNYDSPFEENYEDVIVATFDTEQQAKNYIKNSTLKNPQPRRGFQSPKVFRKNSLLYGYDSATVEKYYQHIPPPHNPTI